MMSEFLEGAFTCIDDCSQEVQECLGRIIIKGFAFVSITPIFRETMANAFNVPVDQVLKLSQSDVIKLGLTSLGEKNVKDSFRFHAELVDELWRLQLKGEGVA